MIIAVDGPVAAGKGTLARRLAAALDYAYLDTGSIYRAVAARILAAGGDPEDPETAAGATLLAALRITAVPRWMDGLRHDAPWFRLVTHDIFLCPPYKQTLLTSYWGS